MMKNSIPNKSMDSNEQSKKILDSLLEHSFSGTSKPGRYIDLGSKRPFTAEQVPFHLNCIREGMDYLEFAELTRRDWRSCYALYRLAMFLMAETLLNKRLCHP